MTPERWQQIKAALAESLELDPGERSAFIDRVAAGDRELREELESLIAAHFEASDEFLSGPAALIAGLPGCTPPDPWVGRHVGAYELIEEIGSGGMGEVYRAVRADHVYEKEVAIKLIRSGHDSAHVVQRFRNERQILATFDHPNIARLLDGGTTPEGLPYFVMELIVGEPIDRFCDRRQLDVSERLRMFLEVCGAVQYAHQRLIVHRDLKPSNILVTEDGVPKLLDFGIAKILESGAAVPDAAQTRTVFRLLTPDYASPEQIRGGPITTASDVFSLGLILYVLLTGIKPLDAQGRTPLTLTPSTRDWEPRRPSSVVRRRIVRDDGRGTDAAPDPQARSAARKSAPVSLGRRLRGDLDTIVLVALRIDPARRYGSVEQLAEDVRRHLSHRPLLARPDTFAYRTGKFIARYALGVAAAGALAAALLAGLLVTTHEARIAQTQRARAERRFADVYSLAHSLIFDINDSIQDLPGSSAARHLILGTGLKYLDSLSKEAAGDAALQHEIASAYEKLGDVQGRALEANEGDSGGAADSYKRALALRRSIVAANARDVDVRRELVRNLGKLSDLAAWNSGDAGDALAYSRETVATSESLAAADPSSGKYRALLATSRLDYGFKLFKIRGDSGPALVNIRAGIAALEPLWDADRSNLRIGRTLSLAYSRAAEVLAAAPAGRAQALSMDRKAHELMASLAKSAPADADFAHLLAFTDHDTAAVLAALGDLDAAQQKEASALQAFTALVQADPKIGEYHMDLSLAQLGMADIAYRRADLRASLAQLEDALAQSAAAERSGGTRVTFSLAKAIEERRIGDVSLALASSTRLGAGERLGYARAARDWYGKAAALFATLDAISHEASNNTLEISGKIRECDAQLASLSHGMRHD
ncbi:MAG TPA: serine/threonine-protein kinase [Steroidobacteraceae bacterium]|nr:serine/threonine-protein kinase [Steroidobacteraceae bacterium]